MKRIKEQALESALAKGKECLGNACTIAEDCKGCGIDASLDAKDV